MNRQITIQTLPSDTGSFSAPFDQDYALLLVIATDSTTPNQRERIVSEVVGSRCQYALTFGHDCKVWHDGIDAACFNSGVPEGRFLMTTWHDDEPIEDVIDFFWWNTFYEEFEAERLAIVQIGHETELEDMILHRMAHHQKQQAEQGGGGNSAALRASPLTFARYTNARVP